MGGPESEPQSGWPGPGPALNQRRASKAGGLASELQPPRTLTLNLRAGAAPPSHRDGKDGASAARKPRSRGHRLGPTLGTASGSSIPGRVVKKSLSANAPPGPKKPLRSRGGGRTFQASNAGDLSRWPVGDGGTAYRRPSCGLVPWPVLLGASFFRVGNRKQKPLGGPGTGSTPFLELI